MSGVQFPSPAVNTVFYGYLVLVLQRQIILVKKFVSLYLIYYIIINNKKLLLVLYPTSVYNQYSDCSLIVNTLMIILYNIMYCTA